MVEKKALIRARISDLADPDFAAFSSKLFCSAKTLIGVRIPLLRKLAKEYVDEPAVLDGDYQSVEECLLAGFVIGLKKCDADARIKLLNGWLDCVDSWGICDSVCSAQTDIKKNPNNYLDFLQTCMQSPQSYRVRFGIVCTMMSGLTQALIDDSLAKLGRVYADCDTLHKALAWAYVTAYTKFPTQVLRHLADQVPNEATVKHMVRKARDSYQIDNEGERQLEKALAIRAH